MLDWRAFNLPKVSQRNNDVTLRTGQGVVLATFGYSRKNEFA